MAALASRGENYTGGTDFSTLSTELVKENSLATCGTFQVHKISRNGSLWSEKTVWHLENGKKTRLFVQ